MKEKLKDLLNSSSNIVFFGGAGVSTESNIPDFRSSKGLYSNQQKDYQWPAEVMLSYTFFMTHTEEFFQFYKDKILHPEAKPNAAHEALAQLERLGNLKGVITQNIDGLHQDAGSENVVELHGSIRKNYCVKCLKIYPIDIMMQQKGVPSCSQCGGIVRPDVTLYEEPLDTQKIEKAIKLIEDADLLIVGGTSLTVYPAAGLIDYYIGNKLVLINKSETSYDSRAHMVINDSIGDTMAYVTSSSI